MPRRRQGVSRQAGPALIVVQPGLGTTVQDRGRPGWQRFGVPVSGALDVVALAAANVVVGNEIGEAALECLYRGPELAVRAETCAVRGGGGRRWARCARCGRCVVPALWRLGKHHGGAWRARAGEGRGRIDLGVSGDRRRHRAGAGARQPVDIRACEARRVSRAASEGGRQAALGAGVSVRAARGAAAGRAPGAGGDGARGSWPAGRSFHEGSDRGAEVRAVRCVAGVGSDGFATGGAEARAQVRVPTSRRTAFRRVRCRCRATGSRS